MRHHYPILVMNNMSIPSTPHSKIYLCLNIMCHDLS